MKYEFMCENCDETFVLDFKMGEAPAQADCPTCGETSPRHYGAVGFVLKGSGWPGKASRVNAQQTAANSKAGARMRKNRDSGPKVVAHDYGGGDVREA
jgi:putative FmdB family regulatory protein